MFCIGVCDDEAYFRQDIEKRLEAYFKGKPFEPEIHIFEKGQALLEEAEKKLLIWSFWILRCRIWTELPSEPV